mgnify:CR=1 FL=1
MKHLDTSLYFITDSTGISEEEFLRRTEEALRGGVTLLQLREKNRTTREYLSLAEKVHALTRRYGVPLLIDDRLDVAMAMDAEGVHLGQSDLPIHIARRILGPDKIVGATAKTVPQAAEAYEQGADYLGVGAVFPTSSKSDVGEMSYETLKAICKAVSIPVVAIGGISGENVGKLAGSGICGVAVISAIYAAKDVKAAAADLKATVKEMLRA